MSYNFNDQCAPEHLQAVQRSLDLCRDNNDNAGLRRWILYMSALKTKCGIIERSCEGCAPETQRLNPCKSCKATPPEPLKTMHGFTEYELVQNANGQIVGMKAYENPPEPTPKIPNPEPIFMAMLKVNDKARQEARKKTRQITIDTNQLLFGKKAIRRFFE